MTGEEGWPAHEAPASAEAAVAAAMVQKYHIWPYATPLMDLPYTLGSEILALLKL